LFLTLPAAAGLLVLAEPIVRVLYERGAFAANNGTPLVSAVLSIFGLGLPAFVLIKAFTPGYFAREDTRTPMYFAAISVLVNVSVALTLFPSIGAPGIATASAIAGWVNAVLLLAVLIRRGHWGRDVGLIGRIPRLLIAAVVMGAVLHFAVGYFAPELASGARLRVQAITLVGLVAAGTAVYFAVAFGIGGADLGMIRRNIKRGTASGDAPDSLAGE
jgi:putative peptidoglycan lipid II flippase